MGYSRSISTVRKRAHLLAPLFRGEEVVYRGLTEDDAQKRAYEIRECFAIARKKPDQLPEVFALSQGVRIKVIGRQILRVIIGDLPATRAEARNPEPVQAMFPLAASSSQAIQAWIDHQPPGAPLFIRQAKLTDSEFGELIRFGGNMEPPLEVVRNGEGIIIRKEEQHAG